MGDSKGDFKRSRRGGGRARGEGGGARASRGGERQEPPRAPESYPLVDSTPGSSPSLPGTGRPAARRGRTCALDLGGARVGVAIDDELGMYAHPRGVLDAKDRPAMLARLVEMVKDDGVTRFVVGLPLDMKGGEGDAARKMRKTAQAIADATGVDVELWDERLTTVEARRALATSDVHGAKARARIDEASAVTILQAWLDARRLEQWSKNRGPGNERGGGR